MSARAMGRLLGIHHTTWLRYLKGSHRPGPGIKYKLARLMHVSSFLELVRQAFRHPYKHL